MLETSQPEQQPRKTFWTTGRIVAAVIGVTVLAIILIIWLLAVLRHELGVGFTIPRYIPAPTNIENDSVSTPITVDGARLTPDWRTYESQQTVEELVAFHQQALPDNGWVITKQGSSPDPDVSVTGPAYCFVAQRRFINRQISAHIHIHHPPEYGRSIVQVYIDVPLPICDYLETQ